MLTNNLKKIRHRMEFDTQKNFAKLLNVSPTQYSKWEAQKEQPTIQTAYQIITILNEKYNLSLKVDDLYTYTP